MSDAAVLHLVSHFVVLRDPGADHHGRAVVTAREMADEDAVLHR